MPNGGSGTKRSEINLEKNLIKKNQLFVFKTQDEICLARALVVAMAKIENDSQYISIKDSCNHYKND